jgi:probable phosphoglycerate mutase
VRLIALRHGQSRYNLLGLCNDDPAVPVDLTELGRSQAHAAATALAGEAIGAIFCSPLPRARQTAEIVAGTLRIDVTEESRLADIRSGFEGRPVADYLAAIAHDPVDASAGGESLRDYAGRVGGFLDELAGKPFETVLLVAHEETLRVIQARCEGLPLAQVAGRPFGNCRPYRFVLA